ncbi:hypothetical protein QL093DRAFT_1341923 [Fusarium oxysporum]|nr:hypothetical protein QL093DRAFT_1341923 [Fusarium oxysporum]
MFLGSVVCQEKPRTGACLYDLRCSHPGYKQAYKAAMPLWKLIVLSSLPISLFHKIHKASVSPLILTVLPLSFILLVQCPLSSLRVRPRSISSSVGSHIRHLTGLYNFLYPKPTTPGQQLHGPPPQPCAINLSSSIRLADAPYYTHAVDRCAAYGRPGHPIQQRTILVGYLCSAHSSHGAQYASPHSYSDSGYHSGYSSSKSYQ